MDNMPQSPNIDDYKLKATDVQEARRNFDGYTKEMEYSYSDIYMGDSAGTTDTDEKTDTNSGNGSGYTRIYKKG